MRYNLLYQSEPHGTTSVPGIQRSHPYIVGVCRAALRWGNTCRRLLLHFERVQRRPYGIKLMVYTLINV